MEQRGHDRAVKVVAKLGKEANPQSGTGPGSMARTTHLTVR